MNNSAHFDWLSDVTPLFKAQESWFDGSYQRNVSLHLTVGQGTPFSISCGAGLLAEHIRSFRFSPPVIQRLGQVTNAQGQSVFQESFLNHLQRLRLRIQVLAAPEGTLLLPGEPLLIIQGPWIQVLLLESAFRLLIWESTHWATEAALKHWTNNEFTEEETPHHPLFPFDPAGWKERAVYIGGGNTNVEKEPAPWPGFSQLQFDTQEPLIQVRRLFKGDLPLGDVWLTSTQDHLASVSRTHIEFHVQGSHELRVMQMTRFQNLFQPVLLKGHPILAVSSLDYLRQRTWKQLEAFHQLDLAAFPCGWFSA